jgi:hypothetical protein
MKMLCIENGHAAAARRSWVALALWLSLRAWGTDTPRRRNLVKRQSHTLFIKLRQSSNDGIFTVMGSFLALLVVVEAALPRCARICKSLA